MSYTALIFFFNDTATTEIYTLSLHDALPISRRASAPSSDGDGPARPALAQGLRRGGRVHRGVAELRVQRDRPHRGPRCRWSRGGAGGAEDGREPLRQREPGRGSAGARGRALPRRRDGRG